MSVNPPRHAGHTERCLTCAADDVASYVTHGFGSVPLPAECKAMRRLVDFVETVEDDPAAFWAALTPAQALELLKVAPKLALPWQDEPDAAFPNAMARRNLDGECIADAFRESKTAYPRWIQGVDYGDAPSLEACRAACDTALRSKGWVLVDADYPQRDID